MKLELVIPSPLHDFVRELAVYCEPACCGLNAFDVDAYTMIRWFVATSWETSTPVLEQLESLIAEVSAHDGAVDSLDELAFGFGHEWPQSADCVAYLQTWRAELVRALSLGPGALELAEPRLAEARLLGEGEFSLTVRRIVGDAEFFLHKGKEAVALKLLSVIASLEDVTISSEVKYARKILAERGARPGLYPS